MIRFSLAVLTLLAISLPFKLSYFGEENTKAAEIAARQDIGRQLADALKSEGYTITLDPTDRFLPSVAAGKDDCALYITPIPVLNDLDASFLFASSFYAEQVTYYFDGALSLEPPIYSARFWEYAARHLPKVGIAVEKRLRLGIAHSSSCDLAELDFSTLG